MKLCQKGLCKGFRELKAVTDLPKLLQAMQATLTFIFTLLFGASKGFKVLCRL